MQELSGIAAAVAVAELEAAAAGLAGKQKLL